MSRKVSFKIPGKKNKYNAVKTEYTSPLIGKRLYDSKKEAARAAELDLAWKNGMVKYWLPQVSFCLPGGVKYRVDFMIVRSDSCPIIYEDVKGRMTPMSKMKIKQVEEIYGIKIDII